MLQGYGPEWEWGCEGQIEKGKSLVVKMLCIWISKILKNILFSFKLALSLLLLEQGKDIPRNIVKRRDHPPKDSGPTRSTERLTYCKEPHCEFIYDPQSNDSLFKWYSYFQWTVNITCFEYLFSDFWTNKAIKQTQMLIYIRWEHM